MILQRNECVSNEDRLIRKIDVPTQFTITKKFTCVSAKAICVIQVQN